MNLRASGASGILTLLVLVLLSPSSTNADSDSLPVAFVRAPRANSEVATGAIADTVPRERYRPGMQVVQSFLSHSLEEPRVVAPGFYSSTDPVYDIDGSRLLFAGKQTRDEPFQIWTTSPDTPQPRLLFATDSDCVQPVCLPGGQVTFASLDPNEFDEHGGTHSFSLYSWRPDDAAPTRLTFNPSSDFEPVVLRDGRMVYSSWQHVGDHWPRGITALLVVNSDGTGIFPYHGSHQGGWLKRGTTALADDRMLHIEADAWQGIGSGTLVETDRNDSFREPTVVAGMEGYEVADVAALPEGRLLVSARLRGQDTSAFELHVYDGRSMQSLYGSDRQDVLAPACGEALYTPELRFSTVVPETPFGYVLILDVNETDRPLAPGSPSGPAASVRVLEGLSSASNPDRSGAFREIEGREGEPLLTPFSATGVLPSRILGEVVPADDGSVYLKVPADRPLRIQLVDANGFVTMNERAWFWVRPNERRVCIGCHEDRELSPKNATPMAASRLPTDLTSPDEFETVSFVDDVRPMLHETCATASCHSPPNPTAGLNLSPFAWEGGDGPLADAYDPAYANLLARQEGKPFAVGGRRVHPGSARQSPLLWMLYGRPLGPQYGPAPFERPMAEAHPGPMLPESQLSTFRKWVDLGAPYRSESAAETTAARPRTRSEN